METAKIFFIVVFRGCLGGVGVCFVVSVFFC